VKGECPGKIMTDDSGTDRRRKQFFKKKRMGSPDLLPEISFFF